jgi:hypothetical protein
VLPNPEYRAFLRGAQRQPWRGYRVIGSFPPVRLITCRARFYSVTPSALGARAIDLVQLRTPPLPARGIRQQLAVFLTISVRDFNDRNIRCQREKTCNSA